MNELPIYLRIRSEYFEPDTSRYRLAITQNTLVQSLRYQTGQNFTIVVNQSPLDPFTTKRQKAFEFAGCRASEEEFMSSPVSTSTQARSK